MGKLQKNINGFAVVELLLVILIIIVIAFVGWFVHHSDHKAKTSSTSTSSLTLDAAVAATKTVYMSLTKNWSKETEISLVNNNPSWFTTKFVNNTKSPSTNNDGLPLECGGNGITPPDSVTYSGVSSDGTQAIVRVTYVYSGANDGSNGSWLVTLTTQQNKWVISGITCPTS